MNLNIRKGQYGWSSSGTTEGENKERQTAYLSVKFAKCQDPTATACQIKIKYGFLSAYYSAKKQEAIPQVVVMEYDLLKEYETNEKPKAKEPKKEPDLQELTEDELQDLPF